MTYREIVTRLEASGIDTAAWDAELLLEHFCGVGRLQLHAEPETSYTSPALERAVADRAARVPLQYLLGEWQFYRQTYKVTPACLVPRSDTELLVEEAIRRLPRGGFFADLCTGSGCIAISVLAERPDCTALAAELSPDALALAEENAKRNGVLDRLTLKRADVLHLEADFWEGHPRPDAILSNPPYIRTEVLPSLSPEVQSEPQMALDGGTDGLLFYRALTALAEAELPPNGFALFEIGYDQADALRAIAARHGFSCRIRKDLGGCDRLAILQR